jgi:acetyl-CoA carboxylase carboxyltransferase component
MAITVENIIPRAQLTNASATYYTSGSTSTPFKTIIDKFTLTNTSAAVVTVSVQLVIVGGSAGASNTVLNNKTLQINETYTCPELVGQVLEAGGFITAIASANTAVTISASGRQIS